MTKHNSKHLALALALAVPILVIGCDSGDDDVGTDDFLDIAGTYEDDFGTTHTINETEWTQSGDGFSAAAAITRWDNDAQFAIAQNSSDAAFNADLWSRFDWVYVESELWYCATIFDAATEEEALNTPRADDSDPATGGCGDFTWSRLVAG